MSYRSLIELNHDYCPVDSAEAVDFGARMQRYMRSGNSGDLPTGATLLKVRHHSEPEFLASHPEKQP